MSDFEVMLDLLQGPEIRTGFLKDGKPVQLKEGREITISTDYSIKGDEETISMSYKKLPVDIKPGNTILCADGTITLTVLRCDPAAGTVRCRCENTSMLGERKNVNLPGVVVDLPTLTEKDKEDILQWGVPNKIDMIALSFVRKGSDLVNVRKVLGHHAKNIQLMSKVCRSLPMRTISKLWSLLCAKKSVFCFTCSNFREPHFHAESGVLSLNILVIPNLHAFCNCFFVTKSLEG